MSICWLLNLNNHGLNNLASICSDGRHLLIIFIFILLKFTHLLLFQINGHVSIQPISKTLVKCLRKLRLLHPKNIRFELVQNGNVTVVVVLSDLSKKLLHGLLIQVFQPIVFVVLNFHKHVVSVDIISIFQEFLFVFLGLSCVDACDQGLHFILTFNHICHRYVFHHSFIQLRESL